MTTTPKIVAFLGMGIMGSAMAANLARTGHQVRVWNRTKTAPGLKTAEAAGASAVAEIGEAVAAADAIFSCLGDVPDVEEVLLGRGGVRDAAKAGSTVVDFTTIGPEAARSISYRLAEHDVGFLDAPVTGGDVGARNATLTIMVGGNEDQFRKVEPMLLSMGSNVRYCGPAGAGQALKLCNQILCAVNMIAVSEAFTLAERLDLDAHLVVDVLSGGAGGSWALANLGARILKSDLGPGFMLKHMIKDLRLIEDNIGASSSGCLEVLPGTRLARTLFEKVSRENGGRNSTEKGTQAMVLAYRGGE